MNTRKQSPSSPEGFQLSLRIRHPSIDPAEISQALKIEAEHCFRAGDPRPSASGLATASMYAESYWIGVLKPMGSPVDISFPGDPWSQVAQKQLTATTTSLTWALSLSTLRLFNTHAALLRRIRSEGGQVTLLVAIYSSAGSFTLASETSQVFGNLGIAVEFELAEP